MRLSIATVKNLLRLAGVCDLIVRFDKAAEQIHIGYTYQGRKSSQQVSFQEIENALSDTDPTQQDALFSNKSAGGG